MLKFNIPTQHSKPNQPNQPSKPVNTTVNTVNQATPATPATPAINHKLESAFENLSSSLQNNDPNIRLYVQEIHAALRDDPACVTILSKEALRTYFLGLSNIARETLIEKEVKTGKNKTKSLSIGVDDLL